MEPKDTGRTTATGEKIYEVDFAGTKVLITFSVNAKTGEKKAVIYTDSEKSINICKHLLKLEGVMYEQTGFRKNNINDKELFVVHDVKDITGNKKRVFARWYLYGESYVCKQYLIVNSDVELDNFIAVVEVA